MTDNPPASEAFPGAWIDHDDSEYEDETVVDSGEPSPSPDATLDKTCDAMAGHAPAAASDRETKADLASATGLHPQSDDKNQMTEPPPHLSSTPDADSDVVGHHSRQNSSPTDQPPTKKTKVTLPETSLDSHPGPMDVDVDGPGSRYESPEKKNHIALPEPSLELHPDAMNVDPTPSSMKHVKPDLDLLHSIKGMFRILDLISEHGSGGLVDKIIIAQESLKELINVLSPGAYASLTKVDFKALDKVHIKVVGVYGSKLEIVAFLTSQGVISAQTARALRLSNSADNSSVPHLRSGLYVLRTSDMAITQVSQQIFVIYWPESTTWNDDAISSVRRNRITFMRYLNKVADQVVCLISPEHARTIVWNDEAEDISMDIEEGSDRLFTFEVAKTNEQEGSCQ